MNTDCKMSKRNYLETIVYVAIILYLLDIIVLGAGNLTKIGGFSTRMLFFASALLGTIPDMVKNWKKYLTNKYCIAVALFFVYLFIAAIVGISGGNDKTILIGDIKGFLNFLIVFPMIYVLTDKKRVMFIVKMLLYVLTGLAVVTLLLSLYAIYPKNIQDVIYDFLNVYRLAIINYLYGDVMRVFLHTASRIMFLGFMFALTLIIYEPNRKKRWEVCAALLLTSLFVTYTRSVYLGIFVCLVFFVITVAKWYKDYIKQYACSLAKITVLTLVFIAILGVCQKENPIKVAIGRCMLAGTSFELGDKPNGKPELVFDNMEAEMDNLSLREERKARALENISKSPIFGNGLGVVNDANGDVIEYFYWDLLSKVGIIGVVLLLLPFVFATRDVLKYRCIYSVEQRFYSYSCLISVLLLLVISYFNPCMNTSVGLAIYGMLLSSSFIWKKGTIENKAHEEGLS